MPSITRLSTKSDYNSAVKNAQNEAFFKRSYVVSSTVEKEALFEVKLNLLERIQWALSTIFGFINNPLKSGCLKDKEVECLDVSSNNMEAIQDRLYEIMIQTGLSGNQSGDALFFADSMRDVQKKDALLKTIVENLAGDQSNPSDAYEAAKGIQSQQLREETQGKIKETLLKHAPTIGLAYALKFKDQVIREELISAILENKQERSLWPVVKDSVDSISKENRERIREHLMEFGDFDAAQKMFNVEGFDKMFRAMLRERAGDQWEKCPLHYLAEGKGGAILIEEFMKSLEGKLPEEQEPILKNGCQHGINAIRWCKRKYDSSVFRGYGDRVYAEPKQWIKDWLSAIADHAQEAGLKDLAGKARDAVTPPPAVIDI